MDKRRRILIGTALTAVVAGVEVILPGSNAERDAWAHDSNSDHDEETQTARTDAEEKGEAADAIKRHDQLLHASRPQWQIGDRWTIATATRPMQGRIELPMKTQRTVWRFEATAKEKVDGHACVRVEVRCLSKSGVRPRTTLWLDESSLLLRQIRTEVAVAGKMQPIVESYAASASHAAVIAPFTALPIAMPVFLPPGSKQAKKSYRYVSRPVASGAKDGGLVRFTHECVQSIASPSAKSLKRVPKQFAKSLEARPAIEVRLSDHARTVIQLWQSGKPWPTYVDNGVTESWLLHASRNPAH